MKRVLVAILHLHKNAGASRSALEHLRYFKSRGWEVHLVAATVNQEAVSVTGAIAHKTLPWIKSTGYWRRRWYSWQVKRLARKLNVDLVIGHGDIDEQDILYLHNDIYLISELVEGKPASPKAEMVKIYGKILSENRFKLMVANSHIMKNDISKRFGISTDKIKVLYPSLNTNEFWPFKPEEKLALKDKFKFPRDKVLVGLITSGALYKRGTDIFIEAVSQLPPELLDQCHFIIVGKDKFDSYADLIKVKGLENNIQYISHINNVHELYGATDIFVLPARFEEFGRSILEAMGSGLPTIVSKFCGCHEIFTGLNKDFILQENTAEELVEKLKILISNSDLRKTLGEMNIKDSGEETEEKVFIKFDQEFERFLNGKT